jgi:hypothetical protein
MANEDAPLGQARDGKPLLYAAIVVFLGITAVTLKSDQRALPDPNTPHMCAKLLAIFVVINVFQVVASTATGGFMTEKSQAFGASGRFAGVFQIAYQTAGLIGGPLGGLFVLRSSFSVIR